VILHGNLALSRLECKTYATHLKIEGKYQSLSEEYWLYTQVTSRYRIQRDLKPARMELRHDYRDIGGRVTPGAVTENASASLQRLKRECHFLRVVPCSVFTV